MRRSGTFRVGILSAMLLLALQVFSQVPGSAVPGTNINMVSGTQFPAGDPYLQRQNEPSMAVSSRNPQHLLAGANDYRSVDIPFPPDSGMETGDAWLGVFTSLDGGQTWSSTLLPGFPQDQSSVGTSSVLHGFAAATDPTVRAGTHGLFYFSGLVFDRGNNAPSGVFVSTFQDQNNKGNGAGAIQQQIKGPGSPFLYRNATVVDTGTSGQFLDKPWIAVDIPRTGTTIGSANCIDASGKSFISGNVYVFYTKFNGSNNNPSSSIEIVSSKNCGASWSKPVKVSQAAQLNQGTVAAIDPGTGTVYVFWRQIGNGKQNQPDAILYAFSTDGGGTWNTGTAYTFPAGSNFDESADSGTFREADLPAATVDGSGRVWLAVSQRNLGPQNKYTRIIVTTLPRGGNQKSWTAPFVADNSPEPGHQFMPALSFAYGKLMLTWYDNREDHTKGVLQCPANMTCTQISELREVRMPITGTGGTAAADSQSAVFAPTISDTGLHVRHTIDVRGALVDPTPFDKGMVSTLAFPSARISQYTFGSRPCSDGSKTCSNPIEQLQFNPPNFPMFSHGTKPFIGDYIDVAALTMLFDQASGKWIFNTSPSNAAVFHATWTDNRDVRPPPVTCNTATPPVCTQNWALYTAVGSAGGQSFYDPSQMKDVCVPGTNDNQTGSRNQNVYTARITQGLLVGVKENTKPLINGNNAPVQRAFSVFARNTTSTVADYRFTVNPLNPNQNLCTTDASGTTASFFQTIPPVPPFTCVNFVDVIAMPRSTVSRTLFVNSTLKYPSVSVTIAQIDQIGGAMSNPGLQSTTAINPDNTNPDITNPDITNPDITNPDITNPDITDPIANAEVYDPTVTNPDITNPDITNPDITNPDITNPDITNPDITSMVVTNPDITNPITNPDITNPDITNPDITNPDIDSLPANGINDVTFKLNNKGNTSSSYSAKEFARQVGVQCCPAGCPGGASCPASCTKCQLIARKIYPMPIANACTLTVQAQNIPISNIPDPAFTTGAFTTPDNGSDSATAQPNATISLGPGEGARVTLRVFGPVDSPQAGTGTTPVKTVGVSGGADTGQNTAATSLTITTTNLPVAVVGTDYLLNSGLASNGVPNSKLLSVGGFRATSWSTTAGTLPAGIMLTSSSGQLSGTVGDSPGAFDVTFRVDDSLTPTSDFDLEKLTIDVNKLTVSSVTVANSNGSLFLKAGDIATVSETVFNQGPATATNVQATGLLVNASAAGTPSGPIPVVNCQPAQPAFAILTPDTPTQVFQYTCTAISGNGFVTFTAGATASYANSAATVPATAAAVTSNSVTVDTTPPALVVTSVTVPGAQPNTVQTYTPGTWTNQPVTVTYSCVDNLSGIAAGTPFITVLNPFGPMGTILPADPLHSSATITLTAESPNSSVSAVCADVAGNTAAPPAAVAPIMIDKTVPQLSVAASTPNGPYTANTWTNQSVTVVYTCNDTFSPVNANSGMISPTSPVVANVPAGAQVSSNQVSPTSATTTVVLTAETAGTTLSATCSDVATNPAAPLPFGPIMIDKTPPTVIGSATTPNGPYTPGAFTNQPVTVTFACQDALSGPVLASISGNQIISGETNTNVQGSCQDVAGNTGTTSFGPVEVDMIGPAISISSPGPNQVFLLNQPVTPIFSCVEGTGGIDQITSCASTPAVFATSPVGPGTFTVNAGDQAGNVAQQSTNYLVTYNFIGFQSPLQLAGTAAKPSNSGTFVQGTAIPLQWQLQDFAQARIIDPAALVSVQAFPNPACSGPAPANAVALPLFSNGAAVGTNTFQVNQAGQFVFTWDTTNTAFGCYNVAVTFNDTVSYVTIVDITSVLVNIAPAPAGGDLISRGFYLPSYSGSSLSQATLSFSSGTAGTYTFSLTAHAGSYDGQVIGSSQATAALDGVQNDAVATSFNFPELPIANASTVAFVIQQVSGPSTGDVFYSVSTCDFTTSCAIPGPQVIETNGTIPPLDTFRRNGVGLKLLGAQ